MAKTATLHVFSTHSDDFPIFHFSPILMREKDVIGSFFRVLDEKLT